MSEQKRKGLKRKAGRRRRQRRRFRVILGIFLFACGVFGFVAYDNHMTYPGTLARDSIHAVNRDLDSITLKWDEARNTDSYAVYVKKHISKEEDIKSRDLELDNGWEKHRSTEAMIKIGGLREGTSYSFVIRPDNEKAEGLFTSVRNFRTKQNQSVKPVPKITKLTCSKPFRIDIKAKTEIEYESDNPEVAEVLDSGEIKAVGPGRAVITVRAKESEEFVGDSTTVDLEVFDSSPVRSAGARAYTIHHLDSDNCEVVKTVTGANGAVIPQSLAYTGDKYIIAYGMGNPDRIISFDVEGEGKEVSVPNIALGHPNGFTYADENGTCYCVKGWSSRAVTYVPETGEYGAINLRYGCSGIGYDRKEKLLYTSSRTLMAAYDISDGYSVVNTAGVVSHSGSWATQDIGGYGGIMIRCLSPSGNTHGTNLIDLYDMREGMYLGSFSCDLSEVESAIVNNDGFLEILANNTGSEDYIWRTDINIATLAEDIDYGD